VNDFAPPAVRKAVDVGEGDQVTAVSVRGRAVRPTPLAWLPWAAIAVAVSLALVMLVLALAWRH
jgi:hypothetical protein